jgi:diguanylate cyclase (GGDEF)-like protein/PAS domain S-box-containing protein
VLVVVRQVVAGREHVALLAETAARRSEAWFRALVQNSADVTIVLDPDHRIRFASPALQRMLRYEPWELAGRPLRDLAFDEDAENVDDLFKRLSREPGQSATREVRLRSKDDSAVAAEVVATNLLEEPLVHGLVFNVRDVSERKALEARLTHQAFHDDLTGLPNRALFLDRVERALARSTRSHEHVAVLFIDLDDFKVVNDSLGHTAGDRFLAAVAQRFAACVRASDTLARLGGDEFAILMEGWHGVERVFDVAGRITQSLETPLRIDDRARVGASIGIAFSQDGRTPDDLLRNADVAMYRAKLYGKGTYEVFEPEMLTSLRRRLETEADLRKAVESAGFCVQYQRIVRLEDAATTGVEALVRWRHPRRGLLSPAEFIPLAEDTGLIVPIQRFVLVEACREVLALRSRPGGGAPLTLAINVSGRHFQSETIVSDVASALERTGFDPKSLVIEITESVLLHPGSATLKALAELKAMGVLLSLDDFGTGYSALGYLQRFPLDILKIDGSFVAHIEEGETAIVKAVIALGAALGLETVAEGVETAGQARTLRALGCPRAQGFYFGRPAFVDELVL